MIVRSEKVLSSMSILSVPFEKSVIISATFISVLPSETLQTKISALEICSPIEGKVNTVFFNNKGAVIREGDILAEIVPTDSGLQIEAFIDPKDIGFIEPGQKVKISLTAYDASKYGYLSGELLQIAQVDIIRGRRSILEYFWQPVAKIKETAFKE